jgi:hypothetical protein
MGCSSKTVKIPEQRRRHILTRCSPIQQLDSSHSKMQMFLLKRQNVLYNWTFFKKFGSGGTSQISVRRDPF